MKSFQAKIINGEYADKIFTVVDYANNYFTTEFHFHEECQLVYIQESEGKRIVGDSIEHFEKGELVFIGTNLPHAWHNDTPYFNDESLRAVSISLYFNPEKLLEHFAYFADIKKLEDCLAKAKRGLKFKGYAQKKLISLLLKLRHQTELDSIISFASILEIISSTKEFDYLASSGYINTYQKKNNDKMDRIIKYAFDHFNEDISLPTIAGIANMNVQAFCRYFKTNTKKSFVQFINEIRIGHACKLLINRDQSISATASDCGFNSISNFNRTFKELKKLSPMEFKKNAGE